MTCYRVLFLAQQIKELENMRSQASFIPTHPQIQSYNTHSSTTPVHQHETPRHDNSAHNSPFHDTISNQGTPVHDEEVHTGHNLYMEKGLRSLGSMISPVSSDGDGLSDNMDVSRTDINVDFAQVSQFNSTRDTGGQHNDHSMHEDTGGGRDDSDAMDHTCNYSHTHLERNTSSPVYPPDSHLEERLLPSDTSFRSEGQYGSNQISYTDHRNSNKEQLEAGEISDDDDDIPNTACRVSTFPETELIESEEEGEVSSVDSSPDTRTVHIARDKQIYNDINFDKLERHKKTNHSAN